MRYIRTTTLATLIGGILLSPGSAPAAASKETQELQRDIAELSDQVKALSKTLDTKLPAIQALAQQASETASKTNENVGSLNTGLARTLQTELKGIRDQLSSVTALGTKIDNLSNDVGDIRTTLQQLVVTQNKQQSMLNDILLQVKMIQAPPVAPSPVADAGTGAAGSSSAPPPAPGALFKSGVDDMNSGNTDLALKEFADFLKLYPNDPNANKVQYDIGEIHYGQAGKLDQAVADFDAVIERYPADRVITPQAYYMKGMALKKLNKTKEAIAAFRAVDAHSDDAVNAQKQLTSMGASTPPASSRKKPAR